MGIISRMRRQNAIYWPPSDLDDYGQRTYGSLVALTLVDGVNSRVRWEDRAEEFVDAEGTIVVSNSVVYCPELPGGGEMDVGGILWLGDRGDLTDETDPLKNTDAAEIRRFDKTPNFKATESLRTAYL